MGKDETSLGRWSWIHIDGNNCIKTTVITAYSPCKPRQHSYYSTFSQKQRYLNINGINECPKINLRKGVLDFIELRKSKRDKIVLMLDGNKNMQTGKLAKALKSELFNMIDSIRIKIGDQKFATHFRCQEKIDAIWISKDLEATKATAFPFSSIGDHRGFLMEVPEELILGNRITKIQQLYARRLICQKKEDQKKYIKELEYQITQHKLVKKMEYINHKLVKKMDYTKNNKSILSKERITNLLNALDKEKTKAMERAESKCRKLKMDMVPYFPGLAMNAINVIFWKAIRQREEGANGSIKYLIRMVKTVEYHGNLFKGILTLEIITQMVINAKK